MSRSLFWKRLIGSLLSIVLLIALATVWLIGREQTLQWALQKVLVSSKLKVTGVSGSLYGIIHVDKISYRNAERSIVAEQGDFKIALNKLSFGELALENFRLGKLTIDQLAPSKDPLKLPQDLTLPIRLSVNDAQIGKVLLSGQGQHTAIDTVHASLSADGHDWRLQNLSAVTEWGKLNAAMTLGAKRPFSLVGQVSLTREGQEKLQTQLHGNLSDLTLNATASLLHASGEAVLRLMPFEPVILREAEIKLRNIDPGKIREGLPSADLSLLLSARLASDSTLSGTLALDNQAPIGSLDQQRLPLQHVRLQLAGKFDAPQMNGITLDLGPAGRLTGQGSMQGGLITLALHTDSMNLKAIHGRLNATKIAGDIVFGIKQNAQTLRAKLEQSVGRGALHLDLDASLNKDMLQLHQAHLRSGGGDVQLGGTLNLIGKQDFKAEGSIVHFNPAQIGSYPAADLNADLHLNGQLAPAWQVALDLNLRNSRLLNQALTGQGKLLMDAQHLRDVDVGLQLGGNQIAAKGNFGAPGDTLDWHIDAPRLQAIGTDFGGVLKGKGSLAGSRQMPQLAFSLDGHDLTLFARHHIKTLQVNAKLDQGENGALNAQLALSGVESGGVKLQSVQLSASGTRAAHVLRGAARGDAFDGFDAQAELRGGWHQVNNVGTWEGNLVSLQNHGRVEFSLQAPAPLQFSGERIAFKDAVLKLPDGKVQLQLFEKNGSHLQTRGQVTGLPFKYLAQFSSTLSEATRDKVDTDLRLGASWDLAVDQTLDGTLRIFRESGDITMRNELAVTLGLSGLEARADIVKNALHAQFDIQGTRLGNAHVDGKVQLAQRNGQWGFPPDAALSLNGTGRMSSIAWMSILSGQPGLELDGTLALDFSASGTAGSPRFKGQLSGDQLGVRLNNEGFKLRNGQLRAHLQDDQLLLETLHFDGTEGSAKASGWLRYADADATMQLQLTMDKLQVLSRPDRMLVVSGQSNFTRDKKHLQLDGKLNAERALFELAEQDAPIMSDDVVVLGAPPKQVKNATSIPFFMDLALDLGEHFSLKGKGLDAQLAGQLRIKSADNRMPRATGSVHVVEGTFAAYGQKLLIDHGAINFSGPLDNPGLDILALRKKADADTPEGNVEVGVEIRGTVQSPTAKLVSTPSVPDSEKLSWLVLGHGTSVTDGSSSKESDLLGVAAGALFGSKSTALQSRVAGSLGIDEIGLSHAKGLESTVMTIGKRISSKAYLTYEQGATSATTLVKLRYALNKRFSVQGQTGANNAVDLLYSWSFD